MKKLLIALSIFISVFIFYNALQLFDLQVMNQLQSYSNEPKRLNLSPGAIDKETFLELIEKYDIIVYSSNYTFEPKHIDIFTNTQDEDYLKGIYLTKGQIKTMTQTTTYSSNAKEEQLRLFNPINNEVLTFSSIDMIQDVSGTFYLKGDNAQSFVNELMEIAPHSIHYLDIDGYSFEPLPYRLVFSVILLILFAGSYIILFNIYLVKNTKQIQLYKLDGRSSFEIYAKTALKPLRDGLFIQLILYCLLSYFFIKTPLFNWGYYIKTLLIMQLFYIASLVLFSLINYATILISNTNVSIKGKYRLNYINVINHVLKFLVIFITFTFVLQSFRTVETYVESQKRLASQYEVTKNLYVMTGMKYTLSMSKVQEDSEKAFNELEQKTKVYSYSSSAPVEMGLEVIRTSKEYLIDFGLVDKEDIESSQRIIAFPETYQYASIIDQLESDYFQKFKATRIKINQTTPPPILNTYILLYSNRNFIYVVDPLNNMILSDVFFEYEGTLEQAKEFLGEILENNNLPKDYIEVERYQRTIADSVGEWNTSNIVISMPIGIMSLCMIVLLDIQINIIDFEKNKQRYFLWFIDGRGVVYRNIRYIMLQLFILIGVGSIATLFMKTSLLRSVIYCLLLLMISLTTRIILSRRNQLEVQQ